MSDDRPRAEQARHTAPDEEPLKRLCRDVGFNDAPIFDDPATYNDPTARVAQTLVQIGVRMATNVLMSKLQEMLRSKADGERAPSSMLVPKRGRGRPALRREAASPSSTGFGVWLDFDDAAAAEAAPERLARAGLEPAFTVLTGREPGLRRHCWIRLSEMVVGAEAQSLMQRLGECLGADRAPSDPPRVPRLPGCVAWPKPGKPGRVAEITELQPGSDADHSVQQVERALDGLGAESEPSPERTHDEPAQPTQPLEDGEAERLLARLRAAPNTLDRHDWVRLATALKGTIGEEAREDWLDFSERYESAVNDGEAERVWKSAKPNGKLGAGTIVHLLREPESASPGDYFKVIDGGAGSEAQQGAAAGAARPLRPTPYVVRDPASIPPRRWLYGRHLQSDFVALTISPGGLRKSSLALVESLAMTTGRPLLGKAPPRPLRVWYWNGEDPRDENDRRLAAARLHHNVTEEDIGGRLFTDSGRDSPIRLAEESRGNALL